MRFASLAAACLLLGGPLHAEPRPVESIVAAVDGSPILLSELKRAVRPRLAHLAGQPAWQRARAERAALREAREDAITAALFGERARRLGLVVTDGEVEAALTRIAADRKQGVAELLLEAEAAGFPGPAYRAELRRQLLEQRLLLSEPHGRVGGEALGAWLERRRAQLLAGLRRRACIERFGRF